MTKSIQHRSRALLAAGTVVAATGAGLAFTQLWQLPGADAAPQVTRSSHAAGSSTYLITCDHDAVKRPVTYDLACGNGTYAIDSMVWSSWGGSKARGLGRYLEHDCTPTCAEGRDISYPVKVTASHRITLDGASTYERVTLQFTGSRPTWAHQRESWDLRDDHTPAVSASK